jgi:hypothetical protein
MEILVGYYYLSQNASVGSTSSGEELIIKIFFFTFIAILTACLLFGGIDALLLKTRLVSTRIIDKQLDVCHSKMVTLYDSDGNTSGEKKVWVLDQCWVTVQISDRTVRFRVEKAIFDTMCVGDMLGIAFTKTRLSRKVWVKGVFFNNQLFYPQKKLEKEATLSLHVLEPVANTSS